MINIVNQYKSFLRIQCLECSVLLKVIDIALWCFEVLLKIHCRMVGMNYFTINIVLCLTPINLANSIEIVLVFMCSYRCS